MSEPKDGKFYEYCLIDIGSVEVTSIDKNKYTHEISFSKAFILKGIYNYLQIPHLTIVLTVKRQEQEKNRKWRDVTYLQQYNYWNYVEALNKAFLSTRTKPRNIYGSLNSDEWKLMNFQISLILVQ